MDYKKIIETIIAMLPSIIVFFSTILSLLVSIKKLVKNNNKDINKVKDEANKLIEEYNMATKEFKEQYEKMSITNKVLVASIKELLLLNPELKGKDCIKDLESWLNENEEQEAMDA